MKRERSWFRDRRREGWYYRVVGGSNHANKIVQYQTKGRFGPGYYLVGVQETVDWGNRHRTDNYDKIFEALSEIEQITAILTGEIP